MVTLSSFVAARKKATAARIAARRSATPPLEFEVLAPSSGSQPLRAPIRSRFRLGSNGKPVVRRFDDCFDDYGYRRCRGERCMRRSQCREHWRFRRERLMCRAARTAEAFELAYDAITSVQGQLEIISSFLEYDAMYVSSLEAEV